MRDPKAAARVGFIAPLIGVALMLIIALAVDVVLGVVIGGAVTIAVLPIGLRLANRHTDDTDTVDPETTDAEDDP